MSTYILSIVSIALGCVMIWVRKADRGMPKPFLRSWPIGIAYTMTTITLLVFGVAGMVVAMR